MGNQLLKTSLKTQKSTLGGKHDDQLSFQDESGNVEWIFFVSTDPVLILMEMMLGILNSLFILTIAVKPNNCRLVCRSLVSNSVDEYSDIAHLISFLTAFFDAMPGVKKLITIVQPSLAKLRHSFFQFQLGITNLRIDLE